MVVREVLDQLANAGAKLVHEVWRRRADESVDVVAQVSSPSPESLTGAIGNFHAKAQSL